MCKIVLNVFFFAWLIAIALLAVGYFGLFGQEQDPLSGIFLIPLGLPWNLLGNYAPEFAKPWVAIFAPGLNYALLLYICKRVKRKD